MPQLSIRPATTPADRSAVIAVAHAANGSTRPLTIYTARRLAAPLRARARWWLLTDGDTPVSSLLCYDLLLMQGPARLPALGFGSVATHPEHQRRGHAARLIEEVQRDGAERGRDAGLLFSAIPPQYYERLGYRVGPAWQWRCAAERLAEVAASGPQAALRPLDPRAEWERLRGIWCAHHGGEDGLGLARDRREDWLRSFALLPGELFFGCPGGYARVADEDGEFEILELFSDEPEASLRALCGLAGQMGVESVKCWLAPLPLLERWFTAESRARTQPMLRGVAGSLAEARFWGADYF